MRVLVDSSVWVHSFHGKQPFKEAVARLLAKEQIVAHDLIYGELLIGDLGGRAKALMLYQEFERVSTVAHEEVVHLVRTRRLFGRGIGWVDAHLLASSLAVGVRLYTADGPLATLAEELGVLYSEDAEA